MEQLTWTNGKRKLSELIPWERNPRQIKADQAERLEESLDEFGQIHAIAIELDGTITDGHQRQLVWSAAEQYGPDYEVDVRVASRKLTEKEREKLSVYLHRGATGEWDYDKLSDFDVPDLLEWGFEEGELLGSGFDFGDEPFLSVAKDAKPNPRKLPIDVIYTLQMADCTCCLAVQAA